MIYHKPYFNISKIVNLIFMGTSNNIWIDSVKFFECGEINFVNLILLEFNMYINNVYMYIFCKTFSYFNFDFIYRSVNIILYILLT